MQLTAIEARIIGCLLEKEVTTPDQYPLSLNALTLACNQKTSREPVMELSETEVQAGIDDLAKKRLISDQSGFGSRVVKYRHRFCNTEFSDFQFSKAEVAIVSLLLLRGPQTAGELRSRAGRQYEFSDISEVEKCLAKLAERDKPLVTQLAREPGKRESRFALLIVDGAAQLQSGNSGAHASGSDADFNADNGSDNSKIAELERRITELEQKLASFQLRFDDAFGPQHDAEL